MLPLLLITLFSLSEIGEKIWQNECNKSREKLIFWNPKEAFPSLGIGHFIWLPKNSKTPFEETFPQLIHFLKEEGISVPTWTEGSCFWQTREAFLLDQQSPKVEELRKLLVKTIPLQVRFFHLRFEETKKHLSTHRTKIERLEASSQGLYALLDYLNFKGNGLSEKERYKGQGWGLLQVLEEMPESGSIEEAPTQFAKAATVVLKRRVSNAPLQNEEHWLPGWLNRLATYFQKEAK